MALTERLALLLQTSGSSGVVRDLNKVADAAKRAGKDAGTATKSFDVFGVQTGITTQALAGGLVAGAAIAGAAIVKFGADSIHAASALNEQIAAAEVTFGSAAQSIVDFADKTSGALGLSRAEALSAANAVGGFFKAAGAGEEDSARASESLVRLSADIASFRDIAGGAPEVLERLRSGLTGEVEPLRRLGIFLNESSVKAKAAELGLGGVGRELNDGEKIAARYALIIEKTGDAQGDMARTGDSLANQSRRLGAEIDRLKEDIGAGLVPVVADVTGALADMVGGVGELGTKAGGVRQSIADFTVGGVRAGDVFDEVGSTVGDIVSKLPGFGQAAVRAGRALADMGDDAQATADATQGDLLAALKISGQQAETTSKQVDDLRSALLSTSAAQRGYDESLVRVSDANGRVIEAQGELNDLLAKGAVDTQEVVQATRSLADARFSLEDASQRLVDAQADLDDLISRGAVDLEEVERATRDLASAERDLQDAHEGVADAQERVAGAERALEELRSGRAAASATAEATDELTESQFAQRRATARVSSAEQRLEELRSSGTATSEEFADAELDLEEAEHSLRKANEAVTEAEDALSEAKKVGSANSEEMRTAEANLADAKRGLRDANQQVADTTQSIVDRQERLRQAQAGDPEFARNLAGARRAVDDANRGVADATQNIIDREAALRQAEAGDPEFVNRVAQARRGLRDAENDVAKSKFSVSEQAYALARAQEEENEAMATGVGAAQRLREKLDALVAAHPEIRGFLGPALARLAELATSAGSTIATGNLLAGARPMHTGGVVPAGVTMPATLHGPEAVIPLGKGGGLGGGDTIYISVAGSIVTERELVDVVHDGLLRKQRQSGALGLN